VIRWHRRGFRAYWRWKSRHVGGRPRILRHDLFKTWRADPTRRPVEAMRVYARQANDVEFQNWAAEIRVHAGDERVSCCMR
jgi:hypothetical protein